MTYDCELCAIKEDTIELFLHHMRKNHLQHKNKKQKHLKFKCILCTAKVISMNYRKHYQRQHKNVFATVTDQPTPSGRITVNTSNTANTVPMDQIDAAVKRIFDKSNAQWSQMLQRMELNRKTVNDIHDQAMATIKSTFEEFKAFMNVDTANTFSSKIDDGIKARCSYYKRKKIMEESPYYIPPKKFINSYRQELNPARNTVAWYANNTAEISIKDNLRRILSIKSFADSLVFPSDFLTSDYYGHPFTGERSRELYTKLGTDFIALSIYCDEFGTVNPLGQAAATNKMMGCYFRINNFPTELQDSNLIFVGFLALAIDLKDYSFQELLKKLLIPQLSELEDGIEISYRGESTRLPVILLNLLGDNLGVHQMSSYTTHFNHDVSCRMCYGSKADITQKWLLEEFTLKTAAKYDELTNREDCIGLDKYGIKNYCVFNRLQNFHVVDASCVDFMHDIPEGHLKKLLVYVVRSIIEDANRKKRKKNLENLNNAVTSFPYTGRLAKNKPQTFFADHIKKGEISLSSAKTILNTALYLPLILHEGKITVHPENKWYRLYLCFLDILDQLLAPKIQKEAIPALQISIETYLEKYIALGGKMTIKPHLTLHYPDTIKRFGALTTCWSMPFENKYKLLKAYERNNNNHKDLAMTIIQRLQEQNVPVYEEMAKDNYLIERKKKKILDYFKVGEICAYDVYQPEELPNTAARMLRVPKLGTVTDILVGQEKIKLKILKIFKYSFVTHAYEVGPTADTVECDISAMKIHKSFPKYGNYVRLPYAV